MGLLSRRALQLHVDGFSRPRWQSAGAPRRTWVATSWRDLQCDGAAGRSGKQPMAPAWHELRNSTSAFSLSRLLLGRPSYPKVAQRFGPKRFPPPELAMEEESKKNRLASEVVERPAQQCWLRLAGEIATMRARGGIAPMA